MLEGLLVALLRLLVALLRLLVALLGSGSATNGTHLLLGDVSHNRELVPLMRVALVHEEEPQDDLERYQKEKYEPAEDRDYSQHTGEDEHSHPENGRLHGVEAHELVVLLDEQEEDPCDRSQ